MGEPDKAQDLAAPGKNGSRVGIESKEAWAWAPASFSMRDFMRDEPEFIPMVLADNRHFSRG